MNMPLSIKIVIGGAGGVGKTTYLHRFIHNRFIADTTLTIGISFLTKNIQRNGQSMVLTLWDLGGQERFRFLQHTYVRGAQAGIVFFDMSCLTSTYQIKEWVDLFRNNNSTDIPIILGGTKLDCVSSGELDSIKEIAMEYVANLGLTCFIPTSAATGTNIEDLMYPIIDRYLAAKGH